LVSEKKTVPRKIYKINQFNVGVAEVRRRRKVELEPRSMQSRAKAMYQVFRVTESSKKETSL
jgi:hypothetical protein